MSSRSHQRAGALMSRARLFVGLGLTTLAACTSKSPSPNGQIASAFDHDSAACASVALEGPPIVSTCGDTEPPQPHGGVLADGTYVLESMTYYGACPANPDQVRQTWVITGTEWDTAQEFLNANDKPDGGTTVWQIASTATNQGTTATLVVTCGPAAMGFSHGTGIGWDGYDASPGRLVIYADFADGSVLASSFVAK